MNSNSNFSVPSLSLTSSRAKRTQGAGTTIPTKDYSSSSYLNQAYQPNVNQQSQRYLEKKSQNQFHEANSTRLNEKSKRPHIFMKDSNTFREEPITIIEENQTLVKQISKNAYLQTKEQYQLPNTYAFEVNKEYVSSRVNLQTSSRKNLLTNPESGKLVSDELLRRAESKKIDINKTLFDRKLLKLFQEANFYDDELNSMGKDDLGKQLVELEEIKNDNIGSLKTIITDLTTLIA